jgi:hypothetical protein
MTEFTAPPALLRLQRMSCRRKDRIAEAEFGALEERPGTAVANVK